MALFIAPGILREKQESEKSLHKSSSNSTNGKDILPFSGGASLYRRCVSFVGRVVDCGRHRRNRRRHRRFPPSRRENIHHPNGRKGEKGRPPRRHLFPRWQVHIRGVRKYGFEEKTFTATTDGGVIRFRAENVSPRLGIMLWEGTVKEDVFEATSTWIRDRWYWKIKREYWYRGRLKE